MRPSKQSSTRPQSSHTTDDLLIRLLILPFKEQIGCINALDLAIQAAEQRLLLAERLADETAARTIHDAGPVI